MCNKKSDEVTSSSYQVKTSSLDVVNGVSNVESSNPFITRSSNVMNDSDFGEKFDELRRVNRRNTIGRFRIVTK